MSKRTRIPKLSRFRLRVAAQHFRQRGRDGYDTRIVHVDQSARTLISIAPRQLGSVPRWVERGENNTLHHAMRIQPHMPPARVVVDVVIPNTYDLAVEGGREARLRLDNKTFQGLRRIRVVSTN